MLAVKGLSRFRKKHLFFLRLFKTVSAGYLLLGDAYQSERTFLVEEYDILYRHSVELVPSTLQHEFHLSAFFSLSLSLVLSFYSIPFRPLLFIYLFLFLSFILQILSVGSFGFIPSPLAQKELVMLCVIISIWLPLFSMVMLLLASSLFWFYPGRLEILVMESRTFICLFISFFFFSFLPIRAAIFFPLKILDSNRSGNQQKKNVFSFRYILQRVLVWCLCRPGQHSIGLKQVRLDGCLSSRLFIILLFSPRPHSRISMLREHRRLHVCWLMCIPLALVFYRRRPPFFALFKLVGYFSLSEPLQLDCVYLIFFL